MPGSRPRKTPLLWPPWSRVRGYTKNQEPRTKNQEQRCRRIGMYRMSHRTGNRIVGPATDASRMSHRTGKGDWRHRMQKKFGVCPYKVRVCRSKTTARARVESSHRLGQSDMSPYTASAGGCDESYMARSPWLRDLGCMFPLLMAYIWSLGLPHATSILFFIYFSGGGPWLWSCGMGSPRPRAVGAGIAVASVLAGDTDLAVAPLIAAP